MTSSFPQNEAEDKEGRPVSGQQDEKVLSCEEEIRSVYQDGRFKGKVPDYDLYEVCTI